MDEQIQQVNESLSRLGLPYDLALVDPSVLRLLAKNARYMSHETFQQLVSNIKRDGALESIPLCHRESDGGLLVLSGNHRVQAAVQAGVKSILVLIHRGELSRSEQVAKQLAHNAIEGKDDPVILKDLWNEIEGLDLKLYAGLDTELLKELDKMEFVAVSDARPDFKTMVLLFLPEEIEELRKVKEDIDVVFAGDENYLASRQHYDDTFRLFLEVKEKYKIVNNPTAFMKIIELARQRLQENQTSK